MYKLVKIGLMLALLIGSVSAQQIAAGAGTASNLFLQMDLSPRSSALSGAYTAIANDANALFYNPAGLAEINTGSLGLNHVQWYEDIRMDNLVFGYNFHRKLGVALKIAHLWMPAIQGKDENGFPTSKLNVSSSIINFGFGYKIHPSLYAGFGIKYFRDDLAGYVADGYAFDAGIFLHLFIPGLTFGASIQNAGGEIQYDKSRERIPFSYRSGLAYKVRGLGLRLALDVVKAVDTDMQVAAGVEYTFNRTVFLRLGNRFQSGQSLFPSYGLGLKLADKYVFDYTFLAHEQLGYTHRAGFTFHFNIRVSRSPKSGYAVPKYSVLKAPRSVSAKIYFDKLIVKWEKVYGARYNVYARTSLKNKWKKLNRHPLYANSMEFKKPKYKGAFYIVISSIINGKESPHSKEANIEVD